MVRAIARLSSGDGIENALFESLRRNNRGLLARAALTNSGKLAGCGGFAFDEAFAGGTAATGLFGGGVSM
jgi:hypothetical protein